jgi:hypothetical protein
MTEEITSVNNDNNLSEEKTQCESKNQCENESQNESQTLFNFIKDPEKLKLLIKTNEILNLNKANHNKIIFVYYE